MKTRQHHVDLTDPYPIVITSFKERNAVQMEMIEDHAQLNGLSLEEAASSWVEQGWAENFGNHYFL